MSSEAPSPVPPESSDWRASVQQSYRNVEVQEIAKVLAALEPGATSRSKLRLAMQFEDAVFKQATSLADYRKRLTKRLKKVQKSYVPSSTSAASESTKASKLQHLRSAYGDKLLYILKHAETAVQQMRHKQGPDKASQLRQHTDSVKSWVADLGLSPDGSNAPINASLSESDVDNLQALLERRTENIRSHVVKLADPDRFLLETMEKTERDITVHGSEILAGACQKRYQQLSRTFSVDGATMLQQALDGVQKSVPLPTRNQRNDTQAALIHLEKMRAACSLVLAWSLVPDKSTLPSGNLLAKAHGTVNEGIDFVTKVMVEFRKSQGRKGVKLEDSWMKVLRLPEGAETSSSTVPLRPVIRSHVLLKPGRKVPSNVLNALKRKRAKLVRPPPNGEGSHLLLDFEDAFTMTIYFAPLLVTLRSQAPSEPRNSTADGAPDERGENVGCATLTPLGFGLSKPRQTPAGTADAAPEWRVWGSTGTAEALGRVVEERLRDASARATFVLRRCFAMAAKETASEFEVELLEATALLEFIQLARTTFIPDWQDDDA